MGKRKTKPKAKVKPLVVVAKKVIKPKPILCETLRAERVRAYLEKHADAYNIVTVQYIGPNASDANIVLQLKG